MSYCRTTLIEYRSEQDADDLIFTYKQNAATDFPDAEILLCTRTSTTTAVMTSLYPSKEKADEAMATRKPILKDAKAKIKSMETHEGDAFSLRWASGNGRFEKPGKRISESAYEKADAQNR